MDQEEITEIILILGEDRIERLYQYIGSKRISVSLLRRFILHTKLCEELRTGKTTIAELALKYRISEMSIYRLLHHLKRFSQK